MVLYYFHLASAKINKEESQSLETCTDLFFTSFSNFKLARAQTSSLGPVLWWPGGGACAKVLSSSVLWRTLHN
jgi:hypothetical protein